VVPWWTATKKVTGLAMKNLLPLNRRPFVLKVFFVPGTMVLLDSTEDINMLNFYKLEIIWREGGLIDTIVTTLNFRMAGL